jgi:hypothetical protein
MAKTSTKKRSNRKPAAAALVVAAVKKKRLSPGSNTSTGKPRKKSRKNVSHQQTIEARDTLDAEYRDWRTVSRRLQYCSHPFFSLSPLVCLSMSCLHMSDIALFSLAAYPSSFARRRPAQRRTFKLLTAPPRQWQCPKLLPALPNSRCRTWLAY